MKLSINQIIGLLYSMIIVLSSSCSKSSDSTNESSKNFTINGSVEKGPFVRGSVVSVFELDENLNPTGRSFKSEISDDKGSFSLKDLRLKSQYVQLSVNGYYFNELEGKLASSPITINAIADIHTENSIHVNVLSHLEEKRVLTLIKEGKMTFAAAKEKALKELYTAFYVKSNPSASSNNISFTKNDQDASVLLGISAALLDISSSNNARLTELMSLISTDLEEDGLLNEMLKGTVLQGLENLNPIRISENLKNRYKELNMPLNDFTIGKFFTVDLKGEDTPSVTENEYFSTEQDYLIALSTLEREVVTSTELYFKLDGLYTKTIIGLPQDDFYQHRVDASNANIRAIFRALYKNVNYANTIINAANKSSNSAFREYANKAYPYLAYSYWQIMNFWGDPFFIDSENGGTSTLVPRSQSKAISQQLLAQIKVSIQQLDGDEVNFARTVAARLAVDIGDYPLAQMYLNQIIESKLYSLAAKSEIHVTGNEKIFGIDYKQSSDLKPVDYDILYGKGSYRNIIRYTEVILLAAEVSLKEDNKSQAVRLLNLVRTRNGKSNISGSENNILAFLQEEIKADLSNEGLYFAFLKRNKLAIAMLNIQPYQELMPIPMEEIMLNPNAMQNPGY